MVVNKLYPLNLDDLLTIEMNIYEALISQLDHLVQKANRVYIGYSGGIDSHVLLHACTQLPELKKKIVAVYVHHGLQSQASAWAIHCAEIAHSLNVALEIKYVNAQPMRGQSPEEAARNARYNAFKSLIQQDDLLLTGQHQEDQLETVLLQLFRGSGLRGLSGMPQLLAFGQGWLVRPLLSVSKKVIIDYAQQQALQFIEDPSNQSIVFDRNFLRLHIIPLLKQRWQSVDKTVARAAKHCAQADEILSTLVKQRFKTVYDATDCSINIMSLQAQGPTWQPYIIREWFAHLGLKMPSENTVQRILSEIIHSAQDRLPIMQAQGLSIRRYRLKLYVLRHEEKTFIPCSWTQGHVEIRLSNQKILKAVLSDQGGLAKKHWDTAAIMIKMRQGGEVLELPNRQGHHTLKKLFQEAGIPPWIRQTIPLIYLNDELAAVGDLWMNKKFYTADQGIRIQFENA
jgi:tRNA(Ile)-lysidine synthase